MAITNPYVNNNQTYPTYTANPSSYVNINAAVPNYQFMNSAQNGIFTRFVSGEQEVNSLPNPTQGCAFYMDGENLVFYVKYADGRPMEVYDMKQRNEPKPLRYLTVDDLNDILNTKIDELSKKFVLRRDTRGNNNG